MTSSIDWALSPCFANGLAEKKLWIQNLREITRNWSTSTVEISSSVGNCEDTLAFGGD